MKQNQYSQSLHFGYHVLRNLLSSMRAASIYGPSSNIKYSFLSSTIQLISLPASVTIASNISVLSLILLLLHALYYFIVSHLSHVACFILGIGNSVFPYIHIQVLSFGSKITTLASFILVFMQWFCILFVLSFQKSSYHPSLLVFISWIICKNTNNMNIPFTLFLLFTIMSIVLHSQTSFLLYILYNTFDWLIDWFTHLFVYCFLYPWINNVYFSGILLFLFLTNPIFEYLWRIPRHFANYALSFEGFIAH